MEPTKAWPTVADELNRAIAQWPPMHSAHEGYAVILEELDELWLVVQKAQKMHPDAAKVAMAKEAKQVAAMAMRFLIDVC